MNIVARALTFAVLSLGAVGNAAAADVKNPLAEQVRAAAARFEDVSTALAEGYTAIPCVGATDGAALGLYYVNPKYLRDEAPDVRRPQALLYEAGDDGRLNLLAAEYITFKGPTRLESQSFVSTGAPNRFGLIPFHHLVVWAWKPNPRGMFADANPDVACEPPRAK